jgi:hypothetical protein
VEEDPTLLLSRARKCRTLARNVNDRRTEEALVKLAEECEARAREIEGGHGGQSDE